VAVGWASYAGGPWRFTGGLSYTLRDGLGLQRPGSSLGVDYRSRASGGLLGSRMHPVLGLFFDANARPRGRSAPRPRLGSAWKPGPGGKEVGVALIGHSGLSTQRQFFRAESRYLGVEVRVDL